jgi:hypothetical protein
MLARKCLLAAGLALLLASSAPAGSLPPQPFTDAVASRLLQQVTRGFITDNQGRVLSAFDAARMPDYGQFRDNVAALFARYQGFRAAFRLRQSWPQGERGVVIAEFDLEGAPLEEGSPPLRRSAQLRFAFARGRQGWKIVDVAPRGFFS